MALCIGIIRDDTPITIPWGWWHVEIATKVLQAEEPEVAHRPILNAWSECATPGVHTVEYAVAFKDPADGEVFTFQPGDIINVWRDR
jgi:hypothetical protein